MDGIPRSSRNTLIAESPVQEQVDNFKGRTREGTEDPAQSLSFGSRLHGVIEPGLEGERYTARLARTDRSFVSCKGCDEKKTKVKLRLTPCKSLVTQHRGEITIHLGV
jgi:hypothetical protein